MRTAIQLSRPTSPLLGDFYLKGCGIYSCEDANLLVKFYAESLFCGDEFTIMALSKMELDDSGMEDASLSFLKAQAWRELGDDTECRRKLDSINLDSLGSSHFGSMVYCFKMLSQLDIGKVDAAASEMAKYSRKVAQDKGFQTNKSLVDLTSAWILYSQGKYSEAYEKTVSMEKQSSDSWGGISAFQSSAANHLLRSHILLKLERESEAQKELAIYRKSGCFGTSLIPKTYRSWIGEAQAR